MTGTKNASVLLVHACSFLICNQPYHRFCYSAIRDLQSRIHIIFNPPNRFSRLVLFLEDAKHVTPLEFGCAVMDTTCPKCSLAALRAFDKFEGLCPEIFNNLILLKDLKTKAL